MNQMPTFFLVATLLAGCSKPATPTEAPPPQAAPGAPVTYPVLVVDEQHQIKGSNPPAAYQIASAAGIRLDATQFHFTYGTNPVTPNMVQFVGGGSVYK